MEDTQKD